MVPPKEFAEDREQRSSSKGPDSSGRGAPAAADPHRLYIMYSLYIYTSIQSMHLYVYTTLYVYTLYIYTSIQTNRRLRDLGDRLGQRFRTTRECWVHLGKNSQGCVSSMEMERFLSSCGYSGLTQHIFGGIDVMDYPTFVEAFGHLLQSGPVPKRSSVIINK